MMGQHLQAGDARGARANLAIFFWPQRIDRGPRYAAHKSTGAKQVPQPIREVLCVEPLVLRPRLLNSLTLSQWEINYETRSM